ncbi:MAG: hypothetical protein [Bacteriophage sp.]|nr:MAG: hypothetical protein [Bacteriophage sp.]
MDEDQNELAESLSGDNEDVENGGVGPGDAEEQGVQEESQGLANEDDPISVKKRLGMQAKKHAREMRQLHERIAQMEYSRGDSANPHASTYQPDPYNSPGQPPAPGANEEDRIQRAVRMALGMREHEEKQAKEAQSHAHVQKQYQRLNDEFDRASDRYEDFDNVVREGDAPFTDAVRDALLFVENPAEVAYRLGKNRTELERISKLHPLDQVREVNKLSFSLLGNNSGKSASSRPSPIGTVRANPTASQTITDKTPAAVIRARMKAGTFK